MTIIRDSRVTFFSWFLIFIITLVAWMIVLSNYRLFLVFHMWVSIVVFSVRVSFFVFGSSGKDDIARVCCNRVFCFCVRV